MTALSVWLALRDVPFLEVGRALASAHWGVLLALSVPSYLLLVWVRALRWRYLTDPIRPLSNGALARANAVGFMANNLFPLRMGEFVRSWYLTRETGVPVAAVFGTVVLERVIDTVAVLALVLLVIPLRPGGPDEGLERGALLLAPFALLPVAGLWALHRWPARVERLAALLLRPFPARYGALGVRALRRFAEGLGALSGGGHLWWIALHSCVIWLVLSIVPIFAAFLALGIELEPRESLLAAWTTQAATGVAVALPSAPGFFGIFHYACRLALVRFGVPPEQAVAAGTLIHAVMWVTLTLLGLAVLRLRRTSLAELDRAAGGSPPPPPPGGIAR